MVSKLREAAMLLGVAAVVAVAGTTIANASDIRVIFRDITHVSKQLDRMEAKLDAALGIPYAPADEAP